VKRLTPLVFLFLMVACSGPVIEDFSSSTQEQLVVCAGVDDTKYHNDIQQWESERDFCYAALASKTRDPRICEFIEIDYLRSDYCYMSLAKTLHDPTLCESVNRANRDLCVRDATTTILLPSAIVTDTNGNSYVVNGTSTV